MHNTLISFSKFSSEKKKPVSLSVICAHHLLQKPSPFYVLRLPYRHYPDSNRNKQPVILLEL